MPEACGVGHRPATSGGVTVPTLDGGLVPVEGIERGAHLRSA